MLPRVLEPEVMDTVAEAEDYDAMDHSTVNRVFVDDFLAALQGLSFRSPLLRCGGEGQGEGASALNDSQTPHPNPLPFEGRGDQSEAATLQPLRIFDAGTGTALIPIELLQRGVAAQITAADLAEQMLIVARRNIARHGFADSIQLVRSDCKRLADAAASFDAVMSNSIVHHIPEPASVLRECWRIVRPGGLLFVRDLLRPDDAATLDRLVQTYAGTANAHGQQMFRDSLHAALTVGEIDDLAQSLGLPRNVVRATSDRHWTLCAIKA